MSTDPEFLWLGEKHKEALAVLKYAIMENKGVLALTGDVGTGKTTLINALLKSLGNDTITATIYDPRLDLLDFFNTVAAAFKIKETFDGKGKFILKFMDFLIRAHERHQKVLLIIDESQGINEDLLEEIRLLSNLEAEYTRLLNIFFVGQNEFIDILQKYENRALRQRVTIRYHIDPLTLNETAAYIRHRLEVSGTTVPIFDSGAIDEIYFFSGGYPRLINIMCDHALLTGYVREVRTINANHIRECREELLVSKKSSEKDFEFPAGNQHMYSREPMAPAPSREPASSAALEEPMPPSPSKGETASDLSREIVDYVKDYQFSEDDQDRFDSQYSMNKPASSRKNPKKRFFRFRSMMIFLLVAGAGYYAYGKFFSKTTPLVTTNRQLFKKYFSMNAKSKNDIPSKTQAQTDAPDIPKQIQPEKPENSHFPAVNSSNSAISRTAVPKGTSSSDAGPSKTLSQNAEAGFISKKAEEQVSGGRAPSIKTNQSRSLDSVPKGPADAEIPKEAASATPNGPRTAAQDLTPKTTSAATLSSKNPAEKFQPSDRTRSRTPPKRSAVAGATPTPPAKAPTAIPAPAITKGNVRKTTSERAKAYTTPRNTKSAVIEPVEKVTEKPEPVELTAKSIQKLKKVKESEALMREKPKKNLAVASSASSKKQTDALFEKFKENLSKKKVGSEAARSAKPPMSIKEKTPATVSVSDQKNSINQKTGNRGDQGAAEKIASLGVSANKSKKTGNAAVTYIPLMDRIDSFLKKYCQTYEQKNLDKLSNLFAFNAVEKGKPFKSWLPTYRQNFDRIDSIKYNIELKRYATQEDTGLVKIDGTFHIRARLEGSKDWLKSSGDISMILEADGNSFKVKELDY